MAKFSTGPAPPSRMRRIRTDAEAIVVMERDISERLRKLRDANKIHNGTLAQALGVSYSSVAKLMAGEGVRQYAKLAIIAQVLGVTPNEILGFSATADRDRLRAAMEAGIMAWGVPEDGAVVTAEAVLQTLSEPIPNRVGTAAASIPVEDILRIQVEQVVRQTVRRHSPTSLRA